MLAFVCVNFSCMGEILSTSANFEYIVFQNQVKMNNTEKEPSKSSSSQIAKETYHAPCAPIFSSEDRNGKTPPTSLETASIGQETFRSHVSDTRNSTLEKIPEVNEKPQMKEASKGFRRLLKFGRKNNNSATERNMETVNEIGANGSTNEGSVILSNGSQHDLIVYRDYICKRNAKNDI